MTQLELYVTGSGDRISALIRKTQQIVERSASDCTVDVIDILEDPEAAERARIIATPTLIRRSPQPERRVIGDISDPETLFEALGLQRAG